MKNKNLISTKLMILFVIIISLAGCSDNTRNDIELIIPDTLKSSSKDFESVKEGSIKKDGIEGTLKYYAGGDGKPVRVTISNNLKDVIPVDIIVQRTNAIVECHRNNKCYDKPTTAGVILCAYGCLVDAITSWLNN